MLDTRCESSDNRTKNFFDTGGESHRQRAPENYSGCGTAVYLHACTCAPIASRRSIKPKERTALALTIGLSSIGLLAGNGIGYAQQSDADKVKAAIDGFHTAISSLDIRKMDDVWAHEPYAMVVNPRDKTVTVGWDAIRKNFEGTVFQFWSELKVTGRDAPTIHINGETAWATGIAVASGKPKAGGDAINAPTFESAVFEKRGDRWLIVSWSAWRVPQ
jgi:ketosteroid isomerase-like protein